MKFKVKFNNQFGIIDEHIEADEFSVDNGNLIFWNVTEKEEIIPYQPGKVYSYQHKYKDKKKVALFSAGQWVYVVGDTSVNV